MAPIPAPARHAATALATAAPGAHPPPLDERGIPTGDERAEPAEAEPIGRRTFDDLYRLGRARELALLADGAAISMRAGSGYPYAQVWVPAGRPSRRSNR